MLLLVQLPLFREHLLFFVLPFYLEKPLAEKRNFCGENVSIDFILYRKSKWLQLFCQLKSLYFYNTEM